MAAAERAPITVAIPTCDRPEFLAEALDSCGRQELQPAEVIVVDDGSCRDNRGVIARFDALPIRYVNTGKIGIGRARNLSTALCRTKYLCVMDDDDVMLPNRIKDHMTAFATGAQVSHGGWINFGVDGDLEYRPGKDVTEDVITYAGAAIMHPACCYETALLRQFPYRTDLKAGEDFEMAARIVRSGARWRHTGSYVLLRRYHRANMSVTLMKELDDTRRVVVNAINFARGDDEIVARTRLGRGAGELPSPVGAPVAEVYGRLGEPKHAARVTSIVPRSAHRLFPLLERIALDWEALDIVDTATTQTTTVGLASLATSDVGLLDRFESEFRKCALTPRIKLVRGPGADPGPSVNWGAPDGTFRVELKSPALRELYLAHRILAVQRDWTWSLAARREAIDGASATMFYMISSPLEDLGKGCSDRYANDILAFARRETNLAARLVS